MTTKKQTEVATQPEEPKQQPRTLRQWVESDAFKASLMRSLPSSIKPEHIQQVMLTTMNKTPELAKCSEGSILNGLLALSANGLRPDGREAAFVPYKGTAQVIIMVGGMIKLLWQSNKVIGISADVIHEGDYRVISKGRCEEHIRWEDLPEADRAAEKGERFAVWADVDIAGGGKVSAIMYRDEVNAIRDRSAAGRSGPWRTDESEMWKKTALRRVFKLCPVSPEAAQIVSEGDFDTPRDIQSQKPARLNAGGVSSLEERLSEVF